MGALTQRDVLFLLWNVAVGLAVGALVLRWPELARAPVPPVLWLVLGMALFEIGGALMLRAGGPLVTYGVRIAGLAASFSAYLLASTAFAAG